MAARCSFCGKGRNESDYLVAGPRGVAICAECAGLAHQVASEALIDEETDLLLTGISRLVTNDERHGSFSGEIEKAAVAVRLGRVTWIGAEADLPSRYRELRTIDCDGRMVVPGFVDAGTHLLGTGHPVRPEPLAVVERAVRLAGRMMSRGVTSLDLRAGGSDDPTIDTMLLAAAREVGERLPLQVSVTWMMGGNMDRRTLEQVMAPTAARLASAVEVACDGDPEALGLRHTLRVTRSLRPRVRICEANPKGCLDASSGALTVEGTVLAAVDGTIPVIRPLLGLDGGRIPGRGLWDAGARPAFSTGSDPEGRVSEGMGLAMALAVAYGGLTAAEALWCATRGGALSMGDRERGRLRAGAPADLVVVDGDEPADVLRTPDTSPAWRVIVGGSIVP